MHVAKVIPIVLAVVLVLLTVVFFFVPALRPAMVDRWFKSAQGFKPAASAEDALDQFKKAIEKRKYDIARDYLTGDYLEFFTKGSADAAELAAAIDELRDVMKSTGVKSDKVEAALYWLDPFPVFKYEVKNKQSGGTLGLIHWNEDASRLRDGVPLAVNERYYEKNPRMWHALLPVGTPVPPAMNVVVKDVGGGVWKIEMPFQAGDRHLRDTVEALRKNATNYRNALRDVKQNIKNNPAVKEDFEREFKTTLEKAN
jgi:hypothetical protein